MVDQGGFVAVPVPAPPDKDVQLEGDEPKDPSVCPALDTDEMEGRQGVVEDNLEALGGTSVDRHPSATTSHIRTEVWVLGHQGENGDQSDAGWQSWQLQRSKEC